MKTLSDILNDADPVASEPSRAPARAMTRAVVLAGPQHHHHDIHPVSRRRVIALAAALVVSVAAAGVFAWRHASVDVAAVQFEARLAESHQTILGNADVQTARVVSLHDRDSSGRTKSSFGVALTFTPEGADKMRRATEQHIGEHLELRIDNAVVMAPLIRSAISSSAMLTGDYTSEQASRIVDGLLKSKLEIRNEK
jgi:hypothetical protein